MSALEIRAELAGGGDHYLVPLAKVGKVPELWQQCVDEVVAGQQGATLVYNPTEGRIVFSKRRLLRETFSSGKNACWWCVP